MDEHDLFYYYLLSRRTQKQKNTAVISGGLESKSCLSPAAVILGIFTLSTLVVGNAYYQKKLFYLSVVLKSNPSEISP